MPQSCRRRYNCGHHAGGVPECDAVRRLQRPGSSRAHQKTNTLSKLKQMVYQISRLVAGVVQVAGEVRKPQSCNNYGRESF